MNISEKFLPVSFKQDFHGICDQLAGIDPELCAITGLYGYPPLWSRAPSFKTIIHFILEQQVSLASAKAALNKLEDLIPEFTPERLLELSPEDLRACYFSRQKAGYARGVAEAIVTGDLVIDDLLCMPDVDIRKTLKNLKGIGDWTVDVFLMMSLHRCDLFPIGDVALVTSTRAVKHLGKHAGKDEILQTAEQWRPYRSVAAYMLWHAYLQKRKKP
ncbi:DNA-3-methyladenine glycosylase 2 family protein [Segetibacter sp. 3557_3]|uniref:DNA-3-methyladenine glycosylase family protein n=1 Tax=Segetibacter sp. 3557_3 TaxID=2547429 RepID=UPI0010591A4C|nr:DNA-3-methyladenine glycosylase [Segetibacter sp. 3557_3]TDH25177.1 DNA-3-methyladenine glycosylase 2 family protein [Segetibacter sp. 3557_3]